MAAVPLPWWTSRSTTAARPARRSRERPADRHRHVVEQAEALAVAGEGVVEAAADVRGDAVVAVEGQPGGGRGCRRSSAGSPRRSPASRESRAGRGRRATGCRGAPRRGSRGCGPAPDRPNRPARARRTPRRRPVRSRATRRSATSRYFDRREHVRAEVEVIPRRVDDAHRREPPAARLLQRRLHALGLAAPGGRRPHRQRAPAAAPRRWCRRGGWSGRRADPASRSSLTFFSFCRGRMISRTPARLRRQHLFLDAADRQHLARQRDLAGHRDVAAHRPPRSARTRAPSPS